MFLGHPRYRYHFKFGLTDLQLVVDGEDEIQNLKNVSTTNTARLGTFIQNKHTWLDKSGECGFVFDHTFEDQKLVLTEPDLADCIVENRLRDKKGNLITFKKLDAIKADLMDWHKNLKPKPQPSGNDYIFSI